MPFFPASELLGTTGPSPLGGSGVGDQIEIQGPQIDREKKGEIQPFIWGRGKTWP